MAIKNAPRTPLIAPLAPINGLVDSDSTIRPKASKKNMFPDKWIMSPCRNMQVTRVCDLERSAAAVTEREYGDRIGIWRIMDMFVRHGLKVTFLMNGHKVEQFADECQEFKAQGHEFSSKSYEPEYSLWGHEVFRL